MASKKCVRCESLDRKQKSRKIHMVKGSSEEEIPICSVCLLEMQEEEDFINSLKEEEDESGGEVFSD